MKRRKAGIVTVGAVACLAAGALMANHRPDVSWPSAMTRLAPFADAIVESGTINAQQMRQYASTISAGSAKIVELAPEGRLVAAGDVLIRFDTARFEEERQRETGALHQLEAEWIRATEDARLDALRAQEDIDAARQQIANAERGLANETSGKGPVAVAEAVAAFAEAERELARSRSSVDDLAPLLAEKFITRAEFEHAEQALQRAADQRRLAAARRDAMVGYERPAAASRAQAELSTARDGLLRQLDMVAARAAQRRSAVAAVKNRLDESHAHLAALAAQVARATVRAESGGLVVYRDLFFGSDRRKPAVGDEAFANQPIVALPDSSQMIVETRVREIDLHKVSASQRVGVRVDAYPELRLRAEVALIGALAADDPTRAGTKWFPVTVRLVDNEPRLRTGMTARVEIEVAGSPAALVVPMAAVFGEPGSPYVVVRRGNQPERRPVVLAGENETEAAIRSGVVAGELVLLVDPTAAAR